MCVLTGLLPRSVAEDQLRAIGPTLGFLVAILVLARLCAAEGLFTWAGWVLASASGGRPISLLGWVIGVGAAVTTVLSLDATVVVVLAATLLGFVVGESLAVAPG